MPDDGKRVGQLIDIAEARGARGMQWHGKLARNAEGAYYPTLANAMILMANEPALAGLVVFDEFLGGPVVMRPPPVPEDGAEPLPGPYPREMADEDVLMVQGHLQRLWSPRFTKQTAQDAMLAETAQRRVHPVREWLDGLKWDGKERLDTWLCHAFGCPDDAYHNAVGSKFLIAAVRRVRQPGCKFDYMPVFEGGQGIGKSRTCAALFGQEWFTDSLPHDLGHKDAAIGLLGVWGVELGELDGLVRNSVETVKAFLSRQVDRYRPPYGKGFVKRPRQGVLVGTTNSTDYLRDTSGNRRFWPVWCEKAEPGWVADNREQLWAEAAEREACGEPIWLDDESVRKTAVEHQAERLSEDTWTATIMDWLNVTGRMEVKVAEIMQHPLALPLDKWTKALEMRVAAVLREAGWMLHIYKPKGVPKTVRAWFAPGMELPGKPGTFVPIPPVTTFDPVTTSEGVSA